LTDQKALSALIETIAELRQEISDVKAALGPLNSLQKRVSEIQKMVVAPRAVAAGDGLILAKLAFDDLMILVDQRDRLIGPHLVMNGVYEKALTAYFRSILHEVGTFVDVGANIGYYTCLFGKHLRDRGRVFAFEPDGENFELLKRNTQINWIDKPNIVLQQVALSDRVGTATLYRNVMKPGNTSLLEPSQEERQAMQLVPHEVPTQTIDSFFADRPQPIDLLKIDVEGHEYPILLGARETILANAQMRLVMEWDPARWVRAGVERRSVTDFLTEVHLVPSLISSRGELTEVSEGELANVPYANVVCRRQGVSNG
jgi:FkbM family methyltransferase